MAENQCKIRTHARRLRTSVGSKTNILGMHQMIQGYYRFTMWEISAQAEISFGSPKLPKSFWHNIDRDFLRHIATCGEMYVHYYPPNMSFCHKSPSNDFFRIRGTCHPLIFPKNRVPLILHTTLEKLDEIH